MLWGVAGAGQVADAEGAQRNRSAFWIRFWTTFIVVSAISFLYVSTSSLPLHLVKAVTVGTVSGFVVARFGDRVIPWLLRLLWWT